MTTISVFNKKNIIRFLIAPLLSIFTVLFIVLWMNNGSISRTNYWSVQKDLFLDLNALLSQFPSFWLNITMLGDALIFLPILSFLIILKPRAWAAIFGAVPLATLLSHGGKMLFSVPRPAAVLDNDTFNIIGGTLNMSNSLPSGHTISVFTGITAIVGVYIISAEKRHYLLWILIGFIFASLLSISRVAVGAHWPLDVVVGAALGYVAGLSGILLTHLYNRWWKWLEQTKYQYIWGILMLVWSVAIFFDAQSLNLTILWLSASSGIVVSICLLSNCVLKRKNNKIPA